MTKKRGASIGQSIGGIIAGIDGQIFRTTPPVNELVAKGDVIPGVAASGGGRLTVDLPVIAAAGIGVPVDGRDEPPGDPPPA